MARARARAPPCAPARVWRAAYSPLPSRLGSACPPRLGSPGETRVSPSARPSQQATEAAVAVVAVVAATQTTSGSATAAPKPADRASEDPLARELSSLRGVWARWCRSCRRTATETHDRACAAASAAPRKHACTNTNRVWAEAPTPLTAHNIAASRRQTADVKGGRKYLALPAPLDADGAFTRFIHLAS